VKEEAATPVSDTEIIRQVLAGEVDRFVELITRYQQHVGRIVAGHVPREMVEEVAHEAFVRAYTSLPSYGSRTPFAHWLARIALRACYDHWRTGTSSRHKEISIDTPPSAASDRTDEQPQQWADRLLAAESEARFDELVRRQETTELLHWALAQLSPENRMVVSLVHLEGCSVREAAGRLGWSVINVKVRAHRARQQLRKILQGLVGDTAS
jgi:RNA polymerase sigma-70 factor, ECF subfamily